MKLKTTKSSYLQKIRGHKTRFGIRFYFPATVIFLILSLGLISFNFIRRQTVTFSSEDGLLLTADRYLISPEKPYIILLHAQNSSRGEFNNIAQRLCKMDYNCLAVDLRNGGFTNPISNETVKRCRENKCPTGVADVEKDIQAAIGYVAGVSDKPVILFGSGANGSLGLKVGKTNEAVKAIVAFSPGEYFLPELSIQDTISGLQKPVLIASSKTEIPYIEELVSGIDETYLTLFKPQTGEGARGIEALGTGNENNSEYWLALLLFFKDLI